MHALITTFWLRGMSEDQYAELTQRFAATFAEIPGLVSKLWLANSETGTYGGVYLFRDRESVKGFLRSPLWHTIRSHPNLADVAAEEFDVQELPTRVTAGGLVAA